MKRISLLRFGSCINSKCLIFVRLGILAFAMWAPCSTIPALAQQNTPVTEKPQKSAQDHLALTSMEELGATPISIDIKNASLSDFIEAVGRATIKPQRIEVRQSEPLTFSLALKDVALAKVLNAAAMLAGCELYLLPDRFLIAPAHALRTEERPLAQRYSQNSSNLKTLRGSIFARSVVSSIQQTGRQQVKFGDLQEPQRKMLQWMANTQSESTLNQPELLPLDAGIALEPRADGGFNLKVGVKSNRKNYLWLNIAP